MGTCTADRVGIHSCGRSIRFLLSKSLMRWYLYIKNGLALRFSRFMGYSLDKAPTQATSMKELRELFKLQFVSERA